MPASNLVPLNIGSAKSPIRLSCGISAYRRNGRWLYRDSKTKRRFGRKFIEASDSELMFELQKRGYKVVCPAHECVDRPNLPCPACEVDGLRALGLLPTDRG